MKNERKIIRRLKKNHSRLEMLLLDSPAVTPYPASYLDKDIVYVWDKETSPRPEDLAVKAPYLQDLRKASELQILSLAYVYPGKLAGNTQFVSDLKSAIMNVLP